MSEDELAIFRRRNLGIVYQFYNLIPTLTAEENIALPWKLDGRKENRTACRMINSAIIYISVDFPEPDAPMIATNSPLSTEKDT